MFPSYQHALAKDTSLPNGTLAIRCAYSFLQRAYLRSTSQWKRWWQTLQQCLCHWISFYHRWSSSTHYGTEKARSKRDQSEIRARSNITQNERDTERDANEVAPCNIYPQKLATVHAMTTFIAQALRRLYATNVWQCVCVCVCLRRVVWVQFVRTSQQLNAAFCNQFLHLCMYHQVCMCVCVCLRPGCVIWVCRN